MAAFAVVVTIDPEGQITLQLFGSDAVLRVMVEVQFVLEGGEQALHHGVIPTAALGGHAAGDAMGLQKLAVSGGPVLAALIGVDQQLVSFHLALTQGPVEGLEHQ